MNNEIKINEIFEPFGIKIKLYDPREELDTSFEMIDGFLRERETEKNLVRDMFYCFEEVKISDATKFSEKFGLRNTYLDENEIEDLQDQDLIHVPGQTNLFMIERKPTTPKNILLAVKKANSHLFEKEVIKIALAILLEKAPEKESKDENIELYLEKYGLKIEDEKKIRPGTIQEQLVLANEISWHFNSQKKNLVIVDAEKFVEKTELELSDFQKKYITNREIFYCGEGNFQIEIFRLNMKMIHYIGNYYTKNRQRKIKEEDKEAILLIKDLINEMDRTFKMVEIFSKEEAFERLNLEFYEQAEKMDEMFESVKMKEVTGFLESKYRGEYRKNIMQLLDKY